MKNRFLALVLACSMTLCALAGCGGETEKSHKYESEVNGKVFSVSYFTDGLAGEGESVDASKLSEIDKRAEDALATALEYITTDVSSNVSVVNQSVNYVFDVKSDFLELMQEVYDLSAFTGGVYKPVRGTAITEGYSCEAFMAIEDGDIHKIDKSATIELAGISESYALGAAVESIKEDGVTNAIISYGNTIARIDTAEEKTPAEIALYTADGDDVADGLINLEGGFASTCTKNDSVIDYVTGEEVKALHDTIVVLSDNSFISSCLAATLRGMTLEEINALYSNGTYEFEAVIVEEDGTVVQTEGIAGGNVFETEYETTSEED